MVSAPDRASAILPQGPEFLNSAQPLHATQPTKKILQHAARASHMINTQGPLKKMSGFLASR